ncbi:MAG: hypothetical protein R3F08_16600 [Dokdonella sp.]|nr:hypothetical protein [Dokdonella sp.]MCB1570286.1 hypothetical protein [Xanthomonadales bacterium]MCB1574549.1 hypothetical protein [Xanthomonadales bacterium]MCB1578333.1 hypothetical protein [Xanthomonadales bacterium]
MPAATYLNILRLPGLLPKPVTSVNAMACTLQIRNTRALIDSAIARDADDLEWILHARVAALIGAPSTVNRSAQTADSSAPVFTLVGNCLLNEREYCDAAILRSLEVAKDTTAIRALKIQTAKNAWQSSVTFSH